MSEIKKRKRRTAKGGDGTPKAKRRAPKAENDPPFEWKSATMVRTNNPGFLLEPAKGCQIPDDLQFLVYSRRLDPSEMPKDPTPLDKREYMLYSNSHPVFDFKAIEDDSAKRKRVYVGYQDPSTGRTHMVQTKKLIVRPVSKAAQAAESATNGAETPQSIAQRREELGYEFGTKRAKKAIEDKLRNELALPILDKDGKARKMDNATVATLEAIGEATAGMATLAELQATAAAAKPIPKADLSATQIQDVYKPSGFIGNDILKSIYVADWISAVEKGENVALPSKFVASRLISVARGPDNRSRLRILRYLLYLIVYFSNSKRKKARIAPLRRQFMAASDASEEITDHLRAKFTNGMGEITKFHEALLLTHILVLAAIIANYEFELADLRGDLKTSQEVMTKHFQELGGKVKESKANGQMRQVATLAMPLDFPRQKVRRGRR